MLSGGPGTGKTSIITRLENQGYKVFHEVSREIIRKEIEKKSNVLPWADLEAFSNEVLKGRIADFHKANSVHFYDRSIIDTFAYHIKNNEDLSKDWLKLSHELRYHTDVFITPPWQEIYTIDNERKESWEDLLDLHDALLKAYANFGYNIVEIPNLTIEERTNFILNKTKLI